MLAPLVRMRLAVSVTNAALERAQRPDNTYLTISEAPAWRLLDYLELVGDEILEREFRAACSAADPAATRSTKKSLHARRRLVAPANQALFYDDPLHVDLSVPEAWVPRVKVGQEVAVEAVAYPGQRFSAKITKIGSEIGRMNRALIAEAELTAGTPLVSGMFAEASITVGTSPMAVVPKTAVVRRGNTWRLFAVSKGHLEERVVQLGPELPGDLVAVVRGVKAGDRVAAKIDEQVVDGVKVE